MCDYKLNGEKLYSVKWYKDNIEFYRYLPRDDPPSLSFSVSGIQVQYAAFEFIKIINPTNEIKIKLKLPSNTLTFN